MDSWFFWTPVCLVNMPKLWQVLSTLNSSGFAHYNNVIFSCKRRWACDVSFFKEKFGPKKIDFLHDVRTRKMEVTIEQIPDASLDQTNCAYCNPSDYLAWSKLGTHVRPIGKNPYFAYQLQV